MQTRVLKNSKDLSLIALAALNIALMTGAAMVTPHALASWSPAGIILAALLSGVAILFLYLTNYQCISHYHIHRAYFRARFLNRAFSVFNTLALGVPQSLYHVHHQFHHKGNNDRRDPKTDSTLDFASSYRFSKDPNVEEGFWSFTLKSVFRAEITPLYVEAVRQGRKTLVVIEFIALFVFWAMLIAFSWKNFVFFYLPLWLLGQILNYAENYVEHHGASHTSPLDNSVSCYSSFYNWIWFNNGYHQEHHYRPGVHWAELPTVRALMLPDEQRRIVEGCHVMNLPWIHERTTRRGRAAPLRSAKERRQG